MKEFFKELFAYGHHSNQRLWEAMMENRGIVPEKSIKLFNHILNAHQIWNTRIDQKDAAFGVWESREISGEKEIDQQNYTNTLTILDIYELESVVQYTNSTGKAFTNSVREILFHLVNHSTYHRGQIASDFRQNSLEPLVSDYIKFKR
ncbi:DinB family protein [Lunatibacter salilacus]|uniref:DinB family protein n=1 Tax=Lunatibacter salilacus TaxID=2483804 RepID=UPI00131E8354|nr:DinB family protein [Lunatibacter salilacus]